MISNWDKSFDMVIAHEGGFTTWVRAAGKELAPPQISAEVLRKMKKTAEDYLGHEVTQDDMKVLKKEDVKPLYKRDYWDAVRGDDLPAGVDYAVFDFAINAGPAAARKMIQRALGVTPDGAIGAITLKAIQEADGKELLEKFSQSKEAFYKALPTFETYGKGWLRRIADVKTSASTMIG